MHHLLFRNAACSCLSFLSKAVSILPRRILQKTLLGMDKSVIPRQLSHTWRLRFLGIFIMSPLTQSLGIVPLSQMVSNKFVRTLVAVLRSAFNISAWMEPTPWALPLFIALMAFLTSASVGGLVSMLRSYVTGGGSAGSSG